MKGSKQWLSLLQDCGNSGRGEVSQRVDAVALLLVGLQGCRGQMLRSPQALKKASGAGGSNRVSWLGGLPGPKQQRPSGIRKSKCVCHSKEVRVLMEGSRSSRGGKLVVKSAMAKPGGGSSRRGKLAVKPAMVKRAAACGLQARLQLCRVSTCTLKLQAQHAQAPSIKAGSVCKAFVCVNEVDAATPGS